MATVVKKQRRSDSRRWRQSQGLWPDGWGPFPTIEMAQNKAYTALLGVSTQEFFNFIRSDPSLLAGIPTLARMAAWGGGFPIKVNGEVVGAIGVSGAPTVQNDVDCARAALALVSDAARVD